MYYPDISSITAATWRDPVNYPIKLNVRNSGHSGNENAGLYPWVGSWGFSQYFPAIEGVYYFYNGASGKNSISQDVGVPGDCWSDIDLGLCKVSVGFGFRYERNINGVGSFVEFLDSNGNELSNSDSVLVRETDQTVKDSWEIYDFYIVSNNHNIPAGTRSVRISIVSDIISGTVYVDTITAAVERR